MFIDGVSVFAGCLLGCVDNGRCLGVFKQAVYPLFKKQTVRIRTYSGTFLAVFV